MNKKLLSVAVAAAMAAPLALQAADGPTVYGQAHLAVEHVDFDEAGAGGNDLDNGDYWHVQSRQSKVGIKGDEDLGGGLKAVYLIEFQIDMDDDQNYNGGATDNVTARNQYVGLSGNWGTFLLGRNDSPFKSLTISRDMFNTTVADWNEVGFTDEGRGVNSGIMDDDRRNDAITYVSPNWNGLTVAAQVAPGERDDDDDGINDAATAIGAKYTNGGLYVAGAWEEIEAAGDESGTAFNDWEKWRIVASYTFGDFTVGAGYEDHDNTQNRDDVDADVWYANASYTFGNNVVKLQYQDGEVEDDVNNEEPEFDAISVGIDHNFSKRTKAYAVYTKTDTNSDAQGGTLVSGDDWDAFGIGLIHNF